MNEFNITILSYLTNKINWERGTTLSNQYDFCRIYCWDDWRPQSHKCSLKNFGCNKAEPDDLTGHLCLTPLVLGFLTGGSNVFPLYICHLMLLIGCILYEIENTDESCISISLIPEWSGRATSRGLHVFLPVLSCHIWSLTKNDAPHFEFLRCLSNILPVIA